MPRLSNCMQQYTSALDQSRSERLDSKLDYAAQPRGSATLFSNSAYAAVLCVFLIIYRTAVDDIMGK